MREYRYTGRFREASLGFSLPHPGIRIPEGIVPRREKALTWEEAMEEARRLKTLDPQAPREGA